MNYLGNDSEDKVQRALLNAFFGAIGIAIGLIIYNKGKNNPSNDFE